jgi:hypothetical protein
MSLTCYPPNLEEIRAARQDADELEAEAKAKAEAEQARKW